MQTNKEAEQVTLSDLGICCGKMFQEPSPAELPKARTSVSSSKRSSELSAVPFMSLDLTPGHGNLLGESYWELISPWRGDASTLNTGVSPREEKESTLSQILEEHPPKKYYLTATACKGILRRAEERGKPLPPQLQAAGQQEQLLAAFFVLHRLLLPFYLIFCQKESPLRKIHRGLCLSFTRIFQQHAPCGTKPPRQRHRRHPSG